MVSLVTRQKLAVLYGPLLHYRLDLFNEISERYELTVFTTAFSGAREGLRFNVVTVPPTRVGPFLWQHGLRRLLHDGQFDACIVFLDVAHLDSLVSVFFPVSRRTFCWGVWLTGTGAANMLRLAAVRRCEGALFYCHKHLEDVAARGVEPRKLYVAPNTVAVPECGSQAAVAERDSILFVGSLAARKGLDRLVRLFSEASPKLPNQTKLIIVGDGPERAPLEALARSLGIRDRVEMPGRVNDPGALASFYARALVSVSLSQAGLSVLQSMGFGVPFLTLKGSISGGEIFNITDGITGFIVADNDAAIVNALRHSAEDPARMAAMGASALAHYRDYATIQNYAQGFYDMLEGTRIAKIWKGQSIVEEQTDGAVAVTAPRFGA